MESRLPDCNTEFTVGVYNTCSKEKLGDFEIIRKSKKQCEYQNNRKIIGPTLSVHRKMSIQIL